jgi:hypothetical protein
MRDFSFGAVIFIGILFIFAKPVRAETIRVSLTADEISYDCHSKQIEAKGNVRISYKKTKVLADQAIINQDQNILLATGCVKVEKDGDEFNGDRFLYYLETRQGWVYPVITEITDEEIEGPLKYTAAEAFLEGEEILFKKTYLTGCDLEHPHYHFTAKQVEYYPGDRIKMRHVWYWEHRVPLFYVPVLFISLKEDSNNFGMQVGWNNFDGWWILSWYTYYFSDTKSLLARNKTTERGVDSWGLEYVNKISPTKSLSKIVEIYDKDKIGNENDDYKFGLKYEDSTNPKMNYEAWLNGWNRYTAVGDSYYESEFALNLKGRSPYPTLKFYHNIKGENSLPETRIEENWYYDINPSASISLNGDWLYSERILEDNQPTNKIDYNFSLFKKWESSNLSVKASERNIFAKEKIMPDITYTIPKLDTPLVGEINVVSQYTHKEKVNTYTDFKTEGDRVALDILKTINIWGKGKLSLTNDTQLRFRDYQINDVPSDLEAITESLNLKVSFTNKFSTTVKAGFTEVQGITNVFFTNSDDIRPGADLRNYWNWNGEIFRANFDTGYNFETEYAYPANFDASLSLDKTSVSFGTIYYWDNGPQYNVGFGATNLSLNSTPRKDWYFRLSLNYDFITQLWSSKRMDMELTEQLTEKWKAGLKVNYDMLIDDFSNANVTLTYDWHCRELGFHYDWVNKEYWLQIAFKAFPQAKFNTSDNPWEYLNYE